MSPQRPDDLQPPLSTRLMSRRAALGLCLATVTLASCSDNFTGVRWEHLPDPTMAPTGPDEALRSRTRQLLTELNTTITAAPDTPDLATLSQHIQDTMAALGPDWDQFPGHDPRNIPGLDFTPEPTPSNNTATATAPPTKNTTSTADATSDTVATTIVAVADQAAAVYNGILTHLGPASPPYAALCGTIAASMQVWAQWLATTDHQLTPIPVGNPPTPPDFDPHRTKKADQIPLGTVQQALAARHAASYHYGVLAGQNTDSRSLLSARLRHVDAEIQLLTQFADARGTTAPPARPAYAPITDTDITGQRIELDRACVQADSLSLQNSLPADREWLCQILTRSATALAQAQGEPPKAISLR